MGLKEDAKIATLLRAVQYLDGIAVWIQKHKRYVRLTMSRCKSLALSGSQVDNNVVQRQTIQPFQCPAGFFLQRGAKCAPGVMDLHHGRYALTDPGQMLFACGGPNGTDGKGPATAQ